MSVDTLVSLRKTTLVDYPGRLALAIFFPFCNLRCPWCHNGALLDGTAERGGLLALEAALLLIKKRAPVLGGVVLSGGEPTLYKKLPALIGEIKKLNLSVKLDTNGSNPAMLEKILKECPPDFIALDLKIAPARYAELALSASAETENIAEKLISSAELIRESGIDCEMRSLALPGGKFTAADIDALSPLAASAPWIFRAFRPGSCLDPSWNDFQATQAETVEAFAAYARSLGKNASSE
jgi:pyruvate formate lyase activating enzyme